MVAGTDPTPQRTAANSKAEICSDRRWWHGASWQHKRSDARNNYWSPSTRRQETFAFTENTETSRARLAGLHNRLSATRSCIMPCPSSPDEDGPMADHRTVRLLYFSQLHIRKEQRTRIFNRARRLIRFMRNMWGRETTICHRCKLCIENNSVSGGCGYGYSCALHTHDQLGPHPRRLLPMEQSSTGACFQAHVSGPKNKEAVPPRNRQASLMHSPMLLWRLKTNAWELRTESRLGRITSMMFAPLKKAYSEGLKNRNATGQRGLGRCAP